MSPTDKNRLTKLYFSSDKKESVESIQEHNHFEQSGQLEQAEIELEEDTIEKSDEHSLPEQQAQASISLITYSTEEGDRQNSSKTFEDQHYSQHTSIQHLDSDKPSQHSSLSYSEPSNISLTSQEYPPVTSNQHNSDPLPQNHPYNTLSVRSRPSDSDHHISPISTSNTRSPIQILNSPSHLQYSSNSEADISASAHTSHHINTKITNTIPSDTSLTTTDCSREHRLPMNSNMPKMKEISNSFSQDIPNSRRHSNYYHNDSNHAAASYDENHSSGFDGYNRNKLCNTSNDYARQREYSKKSASVGDRSFHSSGDEQIRGSDNQIYQRYERRNSSPVLTTQSFFDGSSQVADTIGATLAINQETDEIEDNDRDYPSSHGEPAYDSDNQHLYYLNGEPSNSISYFPVDISDSAKNPRFGNRSTSNKAILRKPEHYHSKNYSGSEPDNETDKVEDEKKKREEHFENEYSALEDFLLTFPGGAKVLGSFYRQKASNKCAGIDNISTSMSRTKTENTDKHMYDQGAFHSNPDAMDFKNDSKSSAKGPISLPTRKNQSSVSGCVPISTISMGSPMPSSSNPGVLTAPRKASVSFVPTPQLIPHHPAYSSNESLSGATVSDNYSGHNTLLDPISIPPHSQRSKPFPVSKHADTDSTYTNNPAFMNNRSTKPRYDDTDNREMDSTPPIDHIVSHSSPHTPPTMHSMDKVSNFEAKFEDIQAQLLEMEKELRTRDEAYSDHVSEISSLKAAKHSLELENQDLVQRVEDLKHELKSLQSLLKKAKGPAKPYSENQMPDSRKTHIPESRKLYTRLELNRIDQLGQIEAQNIIKNVCIQVGSRYSNLEMRLGKLVTVSKKGDIYTNFANDVHRVLYKKDMCWKKQNTSEPKNTADGNERSMTGANNGNNNRDVGQHIEIDPFGEPQQKCLYEMVEAMLRLKKSNEKYH